VGLETYRVAFDPASSRAAGRYVVAGFFSPRELPQAVVRAFLTSELYLFIGLPVLALLGTYLLPVTWRPAAMIGVIAWLLGGAVYLLMLGKSRGLALFNSEGRLVGGLRMKVSRRKLWLAGILVDSSMRGKGMFPALLLGAWRLAASAGRPLTLSVFAPAHPASKRMVEKYLHGKMRIETGSPEYAATLKLLEEEVKALEAKGIRYTFELDVSLLG